MNTIFLRRRRKVYVKEGVGGSALNVVATLQENIESLGFILSKELHARLLTLSPEKLVVFYKNLFKDLEIMVGAHRRFNPMYPDFPHQVMSMSDAEIYLNAWLHYLTNELPALAKKERAELDERPPLRVIHLGTLEEFETIFNTLAKSKTALSLQDKEDVTWFVSQYGEDIQRLLPAGIPSKENLALIGACLLRRTSFGVEYLGSTLKTATDVLRLAAAMSDGDVSLVQPCKFSAFKRKERRALLSWLERAPNLEEDMLRWGERWKRLGERLHPGDYREELPKTLKAFQVVRRALKIETFNSTVQALIGRRDAAGVLEILQKRPSELARRLDHLVRIGNPDHTIEMFSRTASKVSTPVLLQVLAHFSHRADQKPLRVFFPKGDVGKVFAIPNTIDVLPRSVAQRITSACEDVLRKRFAQLPSLGRCYLDERLSNYVVPLAQRSASKALRTLVRGSRMPLPEGPCLRFFLWWKNGKGRTDIDLSAAMFDDNYVYMDIISYYNIKSLGGHHSGDIVDAPKGACEFIDVDIPTLKNRGVRFVVMSINSFTTQPYCDLPECFAGWMSRSNANSGEIFEARTVQDKVDIASDTTICIPAVFDVQNGHVYWADLALKKYPSWNNVQNNLRGVSLMLRAITNLSKPDLKTLFRLHIEARGSRCEDLDSAETVFSVEKGLTPFDTARILADFIK